MSKTQKSFVTWWRIWLILAIGGVGGIAIGLLHHHIENMSDKSVGQKTDARAPDALPAVDRERHAETRFAIFAFG